MSKMQNKENCSVEKPEGPYPTYVEQDGGRVVPVVQVSGGNKVIRTGQHLLVNVDLGNSNFPCGPTCHRFCQGVFSKCCF